MSKGIRNYTVTILIPFVFGIPLFIFGMKELYLVNEFVRRGAHADGIIVEMQKGSGILGKYQPRVRFQAENGITFEFSPSYNRKLWIGKREERILS